MAKSNTESQDVAAYRDWKKAQAVSTGNEGFSVATGSADLITAVAVAGGLLVLVCLWLQLVSK